MFRGRAGSQGQHPEGGRRAPRAPAPASEQVEGVAHGGRGRAQAAEQGAEDARAGLGVGQGPVHGPDLDVQRAGQGASARWPTSGAKRRASATVHSTGGSGQRRPAAANAVASARRSKAALWATITRPRRRSATSPSTGSGAGAAASMAPLIPVRRSTARTGARRVAIRDA